MNLGKSDYNIDFERIKKTIRSESTDLLRLNIKYPKITASTDTPLDKSIVRINEFYSQTASAYLLYAETKLHKKAAACHSAASSDFIPFGVNMNFTSAYADNILTITLSASIYTGQTYSTAIIHKWKI